MIVFEPFITEFMDKYIRNFDKYKTMRNLEKGQITYLNHGSYIKIMLSSVKPIIYIQIKLVMNDLFTLKRVVEAKDQLELDDFIINTYREIQEYDEDNLYEDICNNLLDCL